MKVTELELSLFFGVLLLLTYRYRHQIPADYVFHIAAKASTFCTAKFQKRLHIGNRFIAATGSNQTHFLDEISNPTTEAIDVSLAPATSPSENATPGSSSGTDMQSIKIQELGIHIHSDDSCDDNSAGRKAQKKIGPSTNTSRPKRRENFKTTRVNPDLSRKIHLPRARVLPRWKTLSAKKTLPTKGLPPLPVKIAPESTHDDFSVSSQIVSLVLNNEDAAAVSVLSAAVSHASLPPPAKSVTVISRVWHGGFKSKLDKFQATTEGDFTSEEMDTIDNFISILQSALMIAGCSLPTLSADLVSVHALPSHQDRPKTYICITGLRTEANIRKLEKALGKAGVKPKQCGLDLCYLLDHILRSSASEIYTIAAHQNITYCGTLMRTRMTDRGTSISTIGGLVVIKGKTYALTTNHLPEDEGRPERYQQQIEKRENLLLNPTKIINVGNWQLALVPPLGRLPNVISENPIDLFESFPRSQRSQAVNNYYRFDSRLFFGPREVVIASGRGGLKQGLISKRRTFMLSQATTPQKVWSIDLGCDNLQAGDSGSWVVHKHDNVLLGVLIARSSNSGFLAPFTEVQKEIGAMLSLPPSGIGLPSHQLDENFPGISVQSIEEAEEDLEGPAVMNPAESNAVDSSKKAGKTTGATYDIIVSGVVEVLAVASVTFLFLRRAWLSGPQSTLRLLVTIAEIIFVFGCLIPVIKEGPTWMYIRHGKIVRFNTHYFMLPFWFLVVAGWGVLWRVTLTNECAEEWVCFDCRKIHWVDISAFGVLWLSSLSVIVGAGGWWKTVFLVGFSAFAVGGTCSPTLRRPIYELDGLIRRIIKSHQRPPKTAYEFLFAVSTSMAITTVIFASALAARRNRQGQRVA